jgi:NTP pyrophosphatase (non-canonical NTP hydrolase)
MKEFRDYEAMAMAVLIKDLTPNEYLQLGALNLGGESGEVIDLIKKHCYHGKPVTDEKLKEEVGDVLWALALICQTRGFSMADAAEANIEKLSRRYPHGFSFEAAAARADEVK